MTRAFRWNARVHRKLVVPSVQFVCCEHVSVVVIVVLLLSTIGPGWWRGTVVERRSLTGELSLSCARPAADG